ncbi:transporter substrate-binding domain-containing protein [Bacteriovorax sp. PP10]|uniref:Transporter substrate-binding domain-containing protein n=1 Tax=Bacteriovorax antarcticus TaxID=3088717 RepID=A0ABU5VND2_9BACT|nr:transporter substrate-binding domain-containing protein [Bacteriovorax sp. PP10]MEA9354566.1 transporter substrate-binding domain-containing protein [Bacteriovorax sp. PP10]
MKKLLLLLLFHTPLYAKTITIAFMSDYQPVSFLSSTNGEVIGIEPDIIREAFSEEKNVELKFVGFSWERVQDRVKKGEADAFVSAITPERLSYAIPSKVPVFYDSYALFTYVKHPKMEELKKIKTVNDLHEYTVCEYSGSGWAKKNLVGKAKKIDYGKNVDMKVTMLAARRCDLIIDLDFLVDSLAKRYQVSESIVKLPHVLKGTAYHLLIGKKSPHKKALQNVSAKLKAMHDSGRINQIVQKWVSEFLQ